MAIVHRIDTFLELVVQQNGSDLHLISGQPPRIRLHGALYEIKYRELTTDETTALLLDIMPDHMRQEWESPSCYGADFAYEIPGMSRFRINVMRHLNGVGAVIRTIPSELMNMEALGLPPILMSLCREKKGLILVTGPTGSGKSTTLAAMIDFINQDRKGHIITVEDPVEFTHANKNCLISQREVGVHTPSFSAALHSALREDPDVILVGELRDYETISLAVTAAETGILIFGTLHANGSAVTVDRMINVFPGALQPRIRSMLSSSLRGVVSQQLVRRADGKGRLAALEILVNTPAVANLIREGKTDMVYSVIQSSSAIGMQSLDSCLHRLVREKVITGNEAYEKAVNKQDFISLCEQES
jgi:twitching motility protein PilT